MPGSIDNTPLVKPPPILKEVLKDAALVLKDGAREGGDFALISEAAWEKLHGWYGGGPAIRRGTVVEGGAGGRATEVQLELTLLELIIHLQSDDAAATDRAKAAPLTLHFSRAATVSQLREAVCSAWELDVAKCRLWDYYAKRRYSLLAESEKLDEAKLHAGQDVLVEVEKAGGGWEYAEDDASSSTGGGGGSSSTSTGFGVVAARSGGLGGRSTADTVVDGAKPSTSGVVGLTNLGNTCFMNSMLQCLSNVQPLRTFFVSGEFEPELNPDNPLGAEGKLAEAFSALLKLMWGNGASVVSPRNFKHILGRFAPQFAGYGQQDSQELCNYVLDKLHEDVNRVRKKPYVENFEAKGSESDEYIVGEVRRRHRLRNDSRIADLFEGYFKSTVVCPSCERVSVTFDPFMSVAVPLSVADSRKLTVTLATYDGQLHNLRITVPLSGTVKQLLAAVVESGDVPHALETRDLVCAEVYNAKLQAIYTPASRLEKLQNGDYVFVFETVPPPAASAAPPPAADDASAAAASDRLLVVCVQRAPPSGYGASNKFMGLPVVVSLPRKISSRELTSIFTQKLRHYQRDPEAPPPVEAHAEAPAAADGAAESGAEESSASGAEPAGAPSEAAAAAARSDEPGSAARDEQWRLFYSTMAPGSFGYEALGARVPLSDEPCEFAAPGRGGSSTYATSSDAPTKMESRHIVLEWQASAFMPRGHYDRARVEADEADKAGIGCGRQPVGERSMPSGGGVELRACLDLFSREEKLDAENAWFCDKCKEHREASKKLQVWCLPSVLVVHLKRFSASGMWRRKNDTPVDFPFEIDLAPYQLQATSGEPDMYELQAVSNHYGSTGGGHYTAFARNTESGQWYKFDDSHTAAVDPKDVVTPAAYVLIYVRRGLRSDGRSSPEV